MLSVDGSVAYLSATHMTGGGISGDTDGLAVRRAGIVRVSRNVSAGCGFYDFDTAVRVQHGGTCYLSGSGNSVQVNTSNIGLTTRDGGTIIYPDTSGVTFDSNNTDTQTTINHTRLE